MKNKILNNIKNDWKNFLEQNQFKKIDWIIKLYDSFVDKVCEEIEKAKIKSEINIKNIMIEYASLIFDEVHKKVNDEEIKNYILIESSKLLACLTAIFEKEIDRMFLLN